MFFVPVFYISVLAAFIRKRRTYPFSVRLFLASLLTLMFGMTFLNGFKAPIYLIYVLPFYNAVMAFWLLSKWKGGPDAKLTALGIGVAFALLQITASVQHIQADEYGRDYRKTIARLVVDRAAGKTIVGTAALGFRPGLQWILRRSASGQVPPRAARRSGNRPFLPGLRQKGRAARTSSLLHVAAALTTNFRLVSRAGPFWIFERALPESPATSRPAIDVHELELKNEGEKGEYLFQSLANTSIDSAKEAAADAGQSASESPQSRPMSVSVIMPVMDETVSLRETVQVVIWENPRDIIGEIICVVSKATAPESLAVCRELELAYPGVVWTRIQERPYLGGALQDAFAWSTGTHIMLMASDLETDPHTAKGTSERPARDRDITAPPRVGQSVAALTGTTL